MENIEVLSVEILGKELNFQRSDGGESQITAAEYLELESKPTEMQSNQKADFETEEYKIIAKALQGEVEEEPLPVRNEANLKPLLEIGISASACSSSWSVIDDQTESASPKVYISDHCDSIGTKDSPSKEMQRNQKTDSETEEYRIIAKALQGKIKEEPSPESDKAKLKPLLEIGISASTCSSSWSVIDDQTESPSPSVYTSDDCDSKGTKDSPANVILRNQNAESETEEYKIIAKALQGKVEEELSPESKESKLKPLLEIGISASTCSSIWSVIDDQTDRQASKISTSEHCDGIGTEVGLFVEDFQDQLAKSAASILQGNIGDQFEPDDGRLTGQFFREAALADDTEGQAALQGLHSDGGILNEHRHSSGSLPCEILQGLDVNETAITQEILRTNPLSQSNVDGKQDKVDEELLEAAKILHEALNDETQQNSNREETPHSEVALATWVASICENAFDEILQQRGVCAENQHVQDLSLTADKSSEADSSYVELENLLETFPEDENITTAAMEATRNQTNQNQVESTIYQEAAKHIWHKLCSSAGMGIQTPVSLISPNHETSIEAQRVNGKIEGQSNLPAENSGLLGQHLLYVSERKCTYLTDEGHNQDLQQKKIKLSIDDIFSASWEDCNSSMAKERSNGAGNNVDGADAVGSLSDFECGSVEVFDIVEMCKCDGNEHICNSLGQYIKS